MEKLKQLILRWVAPEFVGKKIEIVRTTRTLTNAQIAAFSPMVDPGYETRTFILKKILEYLVTSGLIEITSWSAYNHDGIVYEAKLKIIKNI